MHYKQRNNLKRPNMKHYMFSSITIMFQANCKYLHMPPTSQIAYF